jgi:hypothetical protein
MSGINRRVQSKRRALVLRSTTIVLLGASALTLVVGCPFLIIPPAITVDAGADQTVGLGATTTVTATVTGATGTVTYEWTILSGAAALSNANQQTATVIAPTTVGSSVLQVTAMQGTASVTDTVTITAQSGVGLSVTVTASPAAVTLPAGSTLSASVTGGTGGPFTYDWQQTGGAPIATIAAPTSQNTSVTFPDAGTYTFVCNVADSVGNTATSAAVSVTVTGAPGGSLIVDAGNVAPLRASTAGTTTALAGTAAESGVDAAQILTTWTATTSPSGSGAIVIATPNNLNTNVTIQAPAPAGDYVFTLTATSPTQTNSDTVTVTLVDAPVVVATQDASNPIRINLVRGSTSRDMQLEYTGTADGTITIEDGLTPGSPGVPPVSANVIASVAATAGTDVPVTVSIPATGNRETADPNAYLLQYSVTDTVGLVNLAILQDPTAGASLRRATLYTSDAMTDTSDHSTVPVIDMNTEAGEVDGVGTIVHQGVGDGDPTLAHVARQVVVADMDGDGLGDLVSLQSAANGVDIRFGAADMPFNGAAPTNGDDWLDTPDVNIDAGANYTGFAVGDFDGDGDLDVALVANDQAQFLQVVLNTGLTSGTNITTADRLWTLALAAEVDQDELIAAGDVNGDGVDDIVAAATGADDANGGVGDDGVVFVIYGTASLPVNGDIFGTAVTGQNPVGTFNGEQLLDPSGAAAADQFGQALAVVDFSSATGLDVIACSGAGDNDLAIFNGGGGNRVSTVVSTVYDSGGVGNVNGGKILAGDTSGDGTTDLIVAEPGVAVIQVPGGTAGGTNITTLAQLPDSTSINGSGQSFVANTDDLALADIDGDTQLDLLIGDTTNDRVLAALGPISTSNNLGEADFFREFNTGAVDVLGDAIALGDVNGDGVTDWVFGATGGNAYSIFGLD